MRANQNTGNQAGRGRNGMTARQADRNVDTTLEFAKELGATGYSEPGERLTRGAGAGAGAGRQAPGNLRRGYGR